ncbi:hypothetical protein B0H14DRAFT_3743597 [Mycena olivaceomarginata]|nr:hypothetical protein B0H14DRAFT_3743597 [Mycena olivaceomarginata]
MPTLLMSLIFKMTRTTRTTIADGALTGHATAVVFSVTFATPVAEAVPFQATVVPLPKQTPTPASAGTATPNPFTGNPFIRQAAGPLQIAGPSSQSSSSKFNDFRFHDDPQPAPNAPLPSPLAAYVQNPWPSITRFQEQAPSFDTVKQQRVGSIARMNAAAGPHSPRRKLTADGSGFAAPSYSGSSTETELNSPPTPGHHKYLICVLPYTYRFATTVQLPGLLRALTARGLVTALEIAERLNTGQNFWLELDSAIRNLLTNSGVVISYSRHYPPPYPFEYSSWEAVGPRSATVTHNRVFAPLGLLERDFNDHAGKLLHNAKRVRHPTQEKIRVLFVAPRWGHLQGPISLNANDRDTAHPCFHSVYSKKTGLMNFDEDEPTSDCLEECPGGAGVTELSDSEAFPLPSNLAFSLPSGPSLKREAPPTDSDSAPKRQKGPTIIIVDDDDAPTGQKPSAADSDIEMDIIDSLEDEPQSANLVRQLIDATGPGPIDRFSFKQVLDILTAIVIAPGPEDTLLPLEVSGPSIDAVATALLALVQHYHEYPSDLDSFVPDEKSGVNLGCPVVPTGFFHIGRSYTIYPDPRYPDVGANGQGPERAVYIAALNSRLQDGSRWTASSGFYFRPQFHPIPDIPKPARTLAYMVDGTWAAMFLVSLGVGPDPICPFLILAATQNDRDWVGNLSLAYINALDPSAAALLAPWFQVTSAQTFKFPRDSAHPAVALVANHLSIPLTEFSTERSEAEHRALHLRLLCHFFFGTYDPWVHPEFKAFVTGFDLRLKGQRTLLSHFPRIDDAKSFIAAVYNRRIQSVDQVISLVKFTTLDPIDSLRDLLYEQFQLRFLRWIRGTGYPRSLRAMSGMPMIPVDNAHRLTIRLQRSPETSDPITLHFHDCTHALDIPINKWMENILLQPVDFDDLATVTDFDHWMSAECSLAGADYNDT